MTCKLCGSDDGRVHNCGVVCLACCKACLMEDDGICPHSDFIKHGGQEPNSYNEYQNNRARTYLR